MTIELMIYIIDFITNIKDVLQITFWMSIIVSFIVLEFTALDLFARLEDFNESHFKKFFTFISSKVKYLFLILLILIFIPSQRTMYLMMGTSMVKSIPLQTTEVYRKSMMILDNKLDEYLKEEKK